MPKQIEEWTTAMRECNDAAYAWCFAHSLVPQEILCEKCVAFMHIRSRSKKTVKKLKTGVEKTYSATVHQYECPQCFNSKTVNAVAKLPLICSFALHLADKKFVTDFHRQHLCGEGTEHNLSLFFMRMASFFNARSCAMSEGQFVFAEWDEMFHGKRKFNRGSRRRQNSTMCFSGGVSIGAGANGKRSVLEGILQHVPTKARANIAPLLVFLTGPGSIVHTDGATMYADIQESGRAHDFVCHDKEYARLNLDGELVHTNSIEGFWSKVDQKMRWWWQHGCHDEVRQAMRYQLCAFAQNVTCAKVHLLSAFLLLVRWWNSRPRSKDFDAYYSLLNDAVLELFVPPKEPSPAPAPPTTGDEPLTRDEA
jgi:hypothetical protein